LFLSKPHNRRGIRGSLIWINFDRHALLNLIQQCAGTFVADIDEIRPQYSNVSDGGQVFQSSVVRSAGPSISSTISALDAQTITSAGQNAQVASPWYSDQVLPFDITLSGANEYGAMCGAKIFGVEILNEGWGISIDDAVSEMQATFVARVVEPMSAIASPFQSRDFRPLPCFGAIEKHYHLCSNYSNIYLYMNHLRKISSGYDFLLPPRFRPLAGKTAPSHRKLRHAPRTSEPETASPAWELYLFYPFIGLSSSAEKNRSITIPLANEETTITMDPLLTLLSWLPLLWTSLGMRGSGRWA
jgi:hypothetical protein